MRAGWLAVVVLAVSAMADICPQWFPEWGRRIGSELAGPPTRAVEPSLLLLPMPVAFWFLALVAVSEDLPVDSDPEERHLVRCAAQYLLVETAYDMPIAVGILHIAIGPCRF